MNLALILVLLTAFTGAVLLVDKLRRRSADDDARRALAAARSGREDDGLLVEYSRSFFPVLLFVLIVRSFIFEPFRIPSGSMMPTLLQGDFIFVKKFSYGMRIPVLETKFLETGEPERGDVVVFRLPTDPSVNYIKRVVGLPGDEVVYDGHRLIINGESVPLDRDTENPNHGEAARFVEQLGDREHAILISNPGYTMRDGTFEVPEGSYFMMGDNRDNSRDSRFIGPIGEEFLVGEAVFIWMNIDGFSWPKWSRIGTSIE